MFRLESLQHRLSETVEWCSAHLSGADPKGSLRTDALRPADDLVETPSLRTTIALHGASLPGEQRKAAREALWVQVRLERHAIVEALCETRARLLKDAERTSADIGVAGGRLLFIEEGVDDGASEDASNGFFDVHDLPPWDTWVVYDRERTRLVSWVPPAFVEMAEAGINANPVDCLQWASSVDDEFTRELRALGLIV